MKQIIVTAFILIAQIAGCSDDVVDVDDMTNGKTLAGTWTLDCDSASDGTMELELEEHSEWYHGTVLIMDTTFKILGYYNSFDNGWGSIWVRPEHVNPTLGGFEIQGRVPPSWDKIHGRMTVYRRLWDVILLEDSVTAIKVD